MGWSPTWEYPHNHRETRQTQKDRGNQDTSRSPDHRTTMLSDCWFELKMMILCLLLEEFRDWKNKILVWVKYDGQGKTKRQLSQFCLNYNTAKSKRMNMYYTSDVHSSILTDYIWKSISKCCWYMVMNRCPQNIFHVQIHIKRFLTKQHFIY